MVEGCDRDSDFRWRVEIEPSPSEGFVSAAETGTEVVGFAQIEQFFSPTADGVDAGLAGELLKVAFNRGALFKWDGDKAIEDIAGFLLNVGHG